MSKKKAKKPSPSRLLSKLVHIRAELDDLIRAAEQQAGYTVKHDDDNWKARCKIVQRADGYWDVVSPDGVRRWALVRWRMLSIAGATAGWYLTAKSARSALADCTVPPPGEGGR